MGNRNLSACALPVCGNACLILASCWCVRGKGPPMFVVAPSLTAVGPQAPLLSNSNFGPPEPKSFTELIHWCFLTQEPAWKRFLCHVGPGFMVSLAYLDPGNCTRHTLNFIPFLLSTSKSASCCGSHVCHICTVETDLQAGSNHRYEVHFPIIVFACHSS